MPIAAHLRGSKVPTNNGKDFVKYGSRKSSRKTSRRGGRK